MPTFYAFLLFLLRGLRTLFYKNNFKRTSKLAKKKKKSQKKKNMLRTYQKNLFSLLLPSKIQKIWIT